MAATDSYTLLPVSDHPTAAVSRRRTCRRLLVALSLTAVLLSLAALLTTRPDDSTTHPPPPTKMVPFSRGTAEGVSEKSTAGLLVGPDYQWTDEMLNWQRPSFHFKPRKNWMNDPDGPMLYNGWYHLFYQYNPYSAVWGNITWGHAVSLDLINWLDLPLALIPGSSYDVNGVWTGSATLLPDGRVVMPYTGSTADSVQVQNLAYPADPVGDPLLIHWRKSDANPVLVPPPGILPKDFRDPSTGWRVPTDESWRVAIGSKNDSAGHAGICLVYKTDDFVHYELQPTLLHSVVGTGMWECIDFYPVSTTGAAGLDTGAAEAGPAVRHVLKASLDDDKHDYYAIGRYDAESGVWEAEEAERDVGIGLRYDYGKYYASKTFYDPARERRVLWGWSGETDSERADILKGWSGLQTIPRTVLFDQKTKRNLLLWPVDEVERLRDSHQHLNNIEIGIGSVVPLDLVAIGSANTFDIVAEFEIESPALTDTIEADIGYNCSTSGGAAGRGALGPFGLLVSADQDLSEQLAVYFYVGRKIDGELDTFFCHDELRSSIADDIVKRVYGNIVPVLDGEILTVRVLVDHSIVESFAQGGRTCITSRVYPTKATYDNSKIFLFNNATEGKVRAKSVTIWQMRSAKI